MEDRAKKKGSIHCENIDFYLDLYAHIKYYRQKTGMRQEDLAAKADISRPYLSSLESSGKVRGLNMETFFNICRALDLPPHKFFEPLP